MIGSGHACSQGQAGQISAKSILRAHWLIELSDWLNAALDGCLINFLTFAGQRFVPGSASSSGRQQPWPAKPVQYLRQHRRHAGCQASRLPSLQVVSASEGEGAVQSLAEDKWIARTLAAFSHRAGGVPKA